MVADFEAGAFDAIVCWDLDRLTRQPRQMEDWVDAARFRGLLLKSVSGDVDLTNENGLLMNGDYTASMGALYGRHGLGVVLTGHYLRPT